MRRYVVFILFYSICLFSWVISLQGNQVIEENDTKKEDDYWFSIYYDERFWKVNTDEKVYDVYPVDYLNVSPLVTGVNLDVLEGKISDNTLIYLPSKIPEFVFEINIAEKYITTQNSAIVYVTDLSDIIPCINTLKMTFRYLDFGKIYLYRNGRIYIL